VTVTEGWEERDDLRQIRSMPPNQMSTIRPRTGKSERYNATGRGSMDIADRAAAQSIRRSLQNSGGYCPD
jgi:hypothetical protein